MNDLVDTTEMYLKTILELEEEEVAALRARIAERLHQSGPTVSQTVARMSRDGLLTVEDDRHLQLTDAGRAHAVQVMRKHRLAELLLVEVVGMPYEAAHDEACRWEHVMSEEVERRVYRMLGRPARSPYGNPIPGLAELEDSAATGPVEMSATAGPGGVATAGPGGVATATTGGYGERHLSDPGASGAVVVRRICESVQTDPETLGRLHAAGIDPGAEVTVAQAPDAVTVNRDGAQVRLTRDVAARVFVTAA